MTSEALVSGYVWMCPTKVEQRLRRLSLTISELDQKIDLDKRTLKSAVAGKRTTMLSALTIAEGLGVSVASILREEQASGRCTPVRHFREWIVPDPITETFTTSNRLQYQVYKLQHRHLPNAFGRGKRYDIAHMTPEQKAVATELVTRHPLVCRRLEGCSQFPRNESVSLEGDQNCWVIDAWEEVAPLPDVISARGLTDLEIPGVALDLLNGLNALHENSIVRRELLPEFIWLRGDDSVLLTELELAKLTDGSPTVSREWAEKPYLAPEIYRGGDVTPAADLYSWARIVWFMLTGEKPRRQATPRDFDGFDFPVKIRRIFSQCVETSPTLRPKSVAAILPDVSEWAVQ